METHDTALEAPSRDDDKLRDVHVRAMRRFNEAVMPQLEIRHLALQARRFVTVPGAMWEDDWGAMFENAPRLEVDKISAGLRKIDNDTRQNRVVPDFRAAGGDSDDTTAETLDGLHRADSYEYKAQQARDNAYSEARAGGFGAYRLTNEWADPEDRDSDAQRINPAMIIVDADQCVFFDHNARTYDKSDARYCFVITGMTREAFEDQYTDKASSWPQGLLKHTYDWFTPEVVRKCEYYEVEDVASNLHIFTQELTGATLRLWDDEIDAEGISDRLAMGWTKVTRRQKRKRVHKYVLSGCEVLKDQGHIAGNCIPIVPVYGKRDYVDGVERFTGYVQPKMDSQRLYNAKVSKLAEHDALAPREIPIFAAEQMPPALAAAWARQNVDRAPYALVNPLIDPQTGQIVSAGPIGTVSPPQLAPVTAALLQIAGQDLVEDQQDTSEQVKANTSAEAMEIAAVRVDAKSGIYLDNIRQSTQREGEIYLSMARDVYYEPGREVETMDEDGGDGTAELVKMVTTKEGRNMIVNDFSRGRYKVMASVTEATATRRDKTVKSALNTASVAMQAGDQDLARAALITAVMNQEGEGTSDMQAYARRKGLEIGLVQPNEDEAKAQAEQQQNAVPDPNIALAESQANALNASAELDKARIAETDSKVALNEAKVIETLKSMNDNKVERPRIRMGNEV
jgi:hypothetical protein